MLDEGDAVDMDAVYLCSELHPLVLLPSDNGAYVGAVYTDNTVFDMLSTEMTILLVKQIPACRQLLVLLCGQKNQSSHDLVESVPSPKEFSNRCSSLRMSLRVSDLRGLR